MTLILAERVMCEDSCCGEFRDVRIRPGKTDGQKKAGASDDAPTENFV